jgi:hypothetical protein
LLLWDAYSLRFTKQWRACGDTEPDDCVEDVRSAGKPHCKSRHRRHMDQRQQEDLELEV